MHQIFVVTSDNSIYNFTYNCGYSDGHRLWGWLYSEDVLLSSLLLIKDLKNVEIPTFINSPLLTEEFLC